MSPRRRAGETRGSFLLAAKAALQPHDGDALLHHAIAFMGDTLAWLHLWQWNDAGAMSEDYPAMVPDDTHHGLSFHL